MSTVKEEVRRVLEGLPDDVTIEEVMYHLYVRQKVEHAQDDVRAGRTVSQEEVERRMEKWLAK